MPQTVDTGAALFAVALVCVHIGIVGCLLVYLYSQAPKKRTPAAFSAEERAAIRRHMRKRD
ncbi:hypothetical protein JKF63_01520 [Porcisia hertigi]|uniref:Uncharacterized protein n=1 Tax=Porcisia hertigi TaxID=2761500 RepID=A0A836ID52_9TRYP|nr:hypothetical protein JKF63_01520 [Porcisia hertigi]